MTSGLGFGAAAADYERFRLGYPDALVDAVLGYAGGPVRTAVEVGAGTGKATRAFAARDIRVTAVEPDPAMAAVLAETTAGLPVEIVVGTFEEAEAPPGVDLLYAAAAWHWTDPGTRWTRAVALLEPGGVLALFGRPGDLADPELAATVEEIERRHLPAESLEPGHPWSAADVRAAAGLGDVVERRVPETVTWTVEEYLGRLGTASAYLALDADQRDAAYTELRAVLPARLSVDATIDLVLARRSAGQASR